MGVYVIEVNQACPSLNPFTYARSPFVQAKMKKKWYWLIRAAPGFTEVPPATGRRRLEVERHSSRPLDPDNLVGGLKCVVIDNLRNLKLLVDDSDKWLELEAVNVYGGRGNKPKTVMRLIDL